MTLATEDVTTRQLSLPEEFILMLLNEESGYFHQVPGWDLNCAVAGAVLAELALLSRIDTDMTSLIPLDRTPTGDPALDPILGEIHDEPVQRNAQYWIERLAPRSEAIIDAALDRLTTLKILEHHDGDYWSLARTAWQGDLSGSARKSSAMEFVRARIRRVIFSDRIPEARDVILICLINTCDVFRFMLPLDEEAEERIQIICKLDVIGQAIAAAVHENISGPLLRRPAFTKPIPTVPLRRLLLNRHARSGSLPALFADLAEKYGPVFRIKPPLMQQMIFLAGPETNRWAHRNGRMHLRARDYMQDFEKIYGASGLIQGLDGGDHFRMRKAMQPGYSRGRLEGQLTALLHHARAHMATWEPGATYSGLEMSRALINAEVSPLLVGVDSDDVISDLLAFKSRALSTHVAGVLPRFMLRSPGMKKRVKVIDKLVERIQSSHTPAQRVGCPRDLADDLLSLHASDPQLLPETNMNFMLSAPLLASMYLGDGFSFAAYCLATQPELGDRIRAEADTLFESGDPEAGDFTPEATDVTRRFIMEALRLYPIVPVSMRNVMNSPVVDPNARTPGPPGASASPRSPQHDIDHRHVFRAQFQDVLDHRPLSGAAEPGNPSPGSRCLRDSARTPACDSAPAEHQMNSVHRS